MVKATYSNRDINFSHRVGECTLACIQRDVEGIVQPRPQRLENLLEVTFRWTGIR